eukprot:scaffold312947_cov14-Tisochrysis_lutea.AAC.1
MSQAEALCMGHVQAAPLAQGRSMPKQVGRDCREATNGCLPACLDVGPETKPALDVHLNGQDFPHRAVGRFE